MKDGWSKFKKKKNSLPLAEFMTVFMKYRPRCAHLKLRRVWLLMPEQSKALLTSVDQTVFSSMLVYIINLPAI